MILKENSQGKPWFWKKIHKVSHESKRIIYKVSHESQREIHKECHEPKRIIYKVRRDSKIKFTR